MTTIFKTAIELTPERIKPLVPLGECLVICYNQIEVWQSRSMAKDFYLEAMCACEGAERDRYTDVLLDLMAGKKVCHDGVTEYLTRDTAFR